jgi:hypothetical protein
MFSHPTRWAAAVYELPSPTVVEHPGLPFGCRPRQRDVEHHAPVCQHVDTHDPAARKRRTQTLRERVAPIVTRRRQRSTLLRSTIHRTTY